MQRFDFRRYNTLTLHVNLYTLVAESLLPSFFLSHHLCKGLDIPHGKVGVEHDFTAVTCFPVLCDFSWITFFLIFILWNLLIAVKVSGGWKFTVCNYRVQLFAQKGAIVLE